MESFDLRVDNLNSSLFQKVAELLPGKIPGVSTCLLCRTLATRTDQCGGTACDSRSCFHVPPQGDDLTIAIHLDNGFRGIINTESRSSVTVIVTLTAPFEVRYRVVQLISVNVVHALIVVRIWEKSQSHQPMHFARVFQLLEHYTLRNPSSLF